MSRYYVVVMQFLVGTKFNFTKSNLREGGFSGGGGLGDFRPGGGGLTVNRLAYVKRTGHSIVEFVTIKIL